MEVVEEEEKSVALLDIGFTTLLAQSTPRHTPRFHLAHTASSLVITITLQIDGGGLLWQWHIGYCQSQSRHTAREGTRI
jgi:hypothetical protein